MLNSPFSPWPSFTKEEADAVSRVLLSNKVNYRTGQEGHKFEKEFSKWVGSEYAIAVTNGTLALELALIALDVGQGDEVIVPSRTFIASASSFVLTGAVPVFADVDLDSQNITAESIAEVITPRTKAIICVHLAGWPCEMDSIMDLAVKHNLHVVEDCAQAHGAKYKGRSIGAIGHIGAWSFCQDKIMTTGGEGGMVTTNDKNLWEKMYRYKDHGKSLYTTTNSNTPTGFKWLHDNFGTNWRLTEMQSTLGRIQIKRMAEWSAKRKANSKRINEICGNIASLRVPKLPDYIEHACYKNYMFVRPDVLAPGWDRDRIMKEINQLGVPCHTGCCPEVYLEKAFNQSGWRPETRLPFAQELGETSLMFLVHPTLTFDEIDKTCKVIEKVMDSASL